MGTNEGGNENMEFTNTKNRVRIAIVAAIVAVLAVAGVAGAMNADRIAHFMKSKTSSPKDYYRYVEKKNRDDALKSFDTAYDKTIKDASLQEQQKRTSVKVEVGDALKPIVSSIGVDSLELVADSKIKDKEVTGRVAVKANDKDALTCTTYMNYETGNLYMQFPELLEGAYLDGSSAFSASGLDTNSLYSAMHDMPDGKTIKNIMTTYTDILYDSFSKVIKSKETLKVDNISQSCTKLEVQADAKAVYGMIETAARQMEKDKDIKSIIEKADSSAYESFQQSMKDFYEELASLDDTDVEEDIDMKMDVWVDSVGVIVGRSITMTLDGQTVTIRHLTPQSGKKFASEFSVTADDVQYITISGKGERKSNLLNATYKASIDDSMQADMSNVLSDTKDIVSVKIKNLDEKALEDGILKGEFEFSGDKIAVIALYSLRCKFDGDKDSSSAEISVMSGQSPMVTLKVKTGEGEDPKVSAPQEGAETYDITDNEALRTFGSRIDIDGFMESLKNNCGIDMTSLFGSLSGLGDIPMDSFSDGALLDDADDLSAYDSTDLDALLGE